MNNAEIRPAGDRALLVGPSDPDQLLALVDRLGEAELAGVADLLPAAETVLVTLRPDASPASVESRIRELLDQPAGPRDGAASASEEVVIPVRYDGEDLADVADLLGSSVEDVIEAHTTRTWLCRFIGFAAGFGYLTSDGPGLVVPRRTQSRTAVPAGAVALADGYSAVYPRRAPGGWQLIGTTDLAMFDLSRPRPALLGPGTTVRFVRADAS